MREREPDGVERGERRGALEGEQRHATLAHERRHVPPGEVAALAAHVRLGVHGVVEDGHAEVGLPHLIDVGIDHAEVEGPLLLLARAPLVVKVARGVLDPREERLDEVEEVLATRPHAAPPPIVT